MSYAELIVKLIAPILILLALLYNPRSAFNHFSRDLRDLIKQQLQAKGKDGNDATVNNALAATV